MTEKTPWLSILIGSYNRPIMLEEAVISCIKAATPEMEIIVSDDGSPVRNEIEERLRPFLKASQIKYVPQPQRLRMAGNWNALVKAAEGEFLMILGDDDRIPPLALRRLRQLVQEHPEGDIYGFGYRVIDEAGRRAFDYCSPRLMHYQINRNRNWKELCYFDAVPMWSHHPFTMAVNRRVYDKLSYRTDVDTAGDVLFLWSALAQGFRFVVLPEVLFEWRLCLAPGDYQSRSTRPERIKHSRALILKAVLETGGISGDLRTFFRTDKFLQRFLCLSDSGLAEVRAVMSTGDMKALMDLVERLALDRRETFGNKLMRHFRAVRVMGIGHVFQVLRYFRDKRQQLKQA
jgi:glycosyltransferase involved in cell wall biosynthesis